jgi:hypothetical protein
MSEATLMVKPWTMKTFDELLRDARNDLSKMTGGKQAG